jgi:hypothetical protein
VEGIYRVLSLLAEERKEGNPFFISEKDAQEMVGEVLERRARDGRVWSLAPGKVGWEELERLARGAWKVNRKEYKAQGVNSWKEILNEPVTEEQIDEA